MTEKDHSVDGGQNGGEVEVMSLAAYEDAVAGDRSEGELNHIAILNVPVEPVHSGLEERGWLLCSEEPVKYVGGFEAAGVEVPGGVVAPMGDGYRLHAHTETALLEEYAPVSPVTLQESEWLKTGYRIVFEPGVKPPGVLDGIAMVEDILAGGYE